MSIEATMAHYARYNRHSDIPHTTAQASYICCTLTVYCTVHSDIPHTTAQASYICCTLYSTLCCQVPYRRLFLKFKPKKSSLKERKKFRYLIQLFEIENRVIQPFLAKLVLLY